MALAILSLFGEKNISLNENKIFTEKNKITAKKHFLMRSLGKEILWIKDWLASLYMSKNPIQVHSSDTFQIFQTFFP